MEFLGTLPKIDKLSSVQQYNTYWGCRIVAVEAGVVGRPWPHLLLLKNQLPDLFVCRAIEVLHSLCPLRIELPHFERPSLAREHSANKHHLNHISKSDVLVYHALGTLLQRRHVIRGPPI